MLIKLLNKLYSSIKHSKLIYIIISPVISFIDFYQHLYYRLKSRKLKNKNFSLLTNNCMGGFIYHDMKLKFNSPTINMYMHDDDFMEFLSDIYYYSNTPPYEVFEEDIHFPIGEIKKGEHSIRIYFKHYATFNDAHDKWVERGKRIDYDNLYVIYSCLHKEGPSYELYDKFKKFNYKKKLVTGNGCQFNDNFIVKLNIFDNNYFPGKIYEFKNKISYHRYLDEFDYISFLNN